jgi:hypothetical protein
MEMGQSHPGRHRHPASPDNVPMTGCHACTIGRERNDDDDGGG